MLPIYKLTIDNLDETGVDYNAFVDVPAHMKSFIAFGKQQSVNYSFNEEQRIVTGVMISANTPIYRRDNEFGEHLVVFDSDTITKIKEKFHRNSNNNNVNEMHDSSLKVDGVFMTASYQIGGVKNPSAPEVFKSQNLQDGTWIASYKVDNDEVWAKVKSGEFKGFSVEGMFYKEKVNLKTNNKMKKEKKSFFELLFGKSEEPTKVEFAQATTTDGVVLMYEGELAEGVSVFIEADGEQIPAPEGDHQITLEDESVKVITVDANGLVTAIVDAEAMETESTDIKEEVAEVMREVLRETHERFNKLEKENVELKAEIEAIKNAKESKFKKEEKEIEDKKALTISEILKNKKK